VGKLVTINLIDSTKIATKLKKLIKKHRSISMAVAWGGLMPEAETLLENRDKFKSVLFGLDFSATDPDLVDRLVDIPNAFVAKSQKGCFHPKIYYFESDAKAEAIIGSANFTRGGLGNNTEASVHISGSVNDPFFLQVRRQLESYSYLQLPVTKEIALAYRRQAEAAKKKPRPANPILPTEKEDWMRINSPLSTMQWVEFAALARQDQYHDFEKRIQLVRYIQQMFSKTPSFADFSSVNAKGFAGVLGANEAQQSELHHIEWGWFGSMRGAGVFAGLICAQHKKLAKALDGIPIRGDVTKEQFETFVEAFKAPFSSSLRTAGLAPATRLLAMKRPDFFVCVNNGNKVGLAHALCFAPTTIDLNNYWRRVIEPIQQASWYNEPRKQGRDMELWDARVAMLDAIYYKP
jgi:HKD family nuclease